MLNERKTKMKTQQKEYTQEKVYDKHNENLEFYLYAKRKRKRF